MHSRDLEIELPRWHFNFQISFSLCIIDHEKKNVVGAPLKRHLILAKRQTLWGLIVSPCPLFMNTWEVMTCHGIERARVTAGRLLGL